VTSSAIVKDQAVGLVSAVNAGRPIPELASEFGIGDGLLRKWVKNSQLGSGGHRAEGEEAVADKLRVLRREVSLLREENNILKQAAVILGTKAQKKGAR